MVILEELKKSPEIYRLLKIIKTLGLSDAWLCAGTLRNYMWNILSNQSGFNEMSDVDVIFFDPSISYEETCVREQELRCLYPDYEWELKNQVYMHVHNPKTEPYLNSCDAVSKYPESCTAIAARLDDNDEIELFLPYGEEDILNFTVRPTPHFLSCEERMQCYRQRQFKKDWQIKWPQIQVRNY